MLNVVKHLANVSGKVPARDPFASLRMTEAMVGIYIIIYIKARQAHRTCLASCGTSLALVVEHHRHQEHEQLFGLVLLGRYEHAGA